MLSRQEELKERARVLLEQARRDAALKAGNKQLTSTLIPARNKQLNDVRNIGRSCSLQSSNALCVLSWGEACPCRTFLLCVWCVMCPSFTSKTCFSWCYGQEKGASHFLGRSLGASSLIGSAVSGGMKLKHYLLNDSEVICAVSDCFSFS